MKNFLREFRKDAVKRRFPNLVEGRILVRTPMHKEKRHFDHRYFVVVASIDEELLK